MLWLYKENTDYSRSLLYSSGLEVWSCRLSLQKDVSKEIYEKCRDFDHTEI